MNQMFSVIIPTFNRLAYLRKAINSVLEQAYQNFEIVLVNDNPKDREEIDKLYGNHKKITVIHHEKPKGGNAARNTGIRTSKGELISFLDDDDIWLPEKLLTHFQFHEAYPECGLIYSDCINVYESKYIKDHLKISFLPDDLVKTMRTGTFCPATSSAVTIKRECITNCGDFDESLVSFQDWDMWFRIAHQYKFLRIPVALVHFRQHNGERTSQNENKRTEGFQQLTKKWNNKIDINSFQRVNWRSSHYHNSIRLLSKGQLYSAFFSSTQLLKPAFLEVNSIKTFLMISKRIFMNFLRK